jgi:polysaccharide chain length determinant protein (PEP-CTERM system associated)
MNASSKAPFIRAEYMPLSIVRAIWKGKYLAIAIWIAGSLATLYYVSRLPVSYYAEALILVDAQKIPSQYVSSTVSTSLQDRLATINRQILSSSRLAKVIEEAKMYRGEAPVPEPLLMAVRSSIKVTVEKGWAGDMPGAVRVGYDGPDAHFVAEMANRIANLYVEENLKTRETQAEGTTEFIESLLTEAKKKLDAQEAALSHYKVQHTGELPQQENALIGTLDRLHTELKANNDGINRAQETKVMLDNSLHVAEATMATLAHAVATGTPAPPEAIAAVETAAPAAAKPVAPPRRSEVLANELAQLRLRYNEQHPDIRKLKEELAAARDADEAEDRQAAARLAAAPPAPPKRTPATAVKASPKANPADVMELTKARERVAALKVQIAANEKELEARAADQERIRRDIAVYQKRVDGLPFREQEIGDLTRDYEITKGTYQSLLGKKVAAEMGTDLERRQKAERFTILEPASVPLAPYRPNRRLMNLMGCGFALLLGLAAAFGNELRRNVLLGGWEFSPQTPILGTLPNIVIERQHFQPRSLWRSALRVAGWSTALSLLAIGSYLALKRF